MSERIRGQETTLQVLVDGEQLSGSFTKVSDFKLTPRTDLSDSPFLGETEDEPDIQHHGYDFSFSTHEMDNKAVQLLMNMVARLTAGLPVQVINLVVIKRYRDPAAGTAAQVLQQCMLKLDGQDFGGRKDYIKNSFTGKCRTMRVL